MKHRSLGMKKIIGFVVVLCALGFASVDAQVIELVKDVKLGSGHSNPTVLTAYHNKLYFIATSAAQGSELWETQGTPNTTKLIKTLRTKYNQSGIVHSIECIVYHDKFYFAEADDKDGFILWQSDGTIDGTTAVKQFTPSTRSFNPYSLTLFNDKLFFLAGDELSNSAIWMSDGTTTGTAILKNITPNSRLLPLPNTLLYIDSFRLWRTDGSIGGSQKLSDNISVFADYVRLDKDKVYFLGFNLNAPNDILLYISDGTTSGTVPLKGDYPKTRTSLVRFVTTLNNKFYFTAYDSNNNNILWSYDNTSKGFEQVRFLNNDGGLFGTAIYNNKFYFTLYTPFFTNEMWVSDGTFDGTSVAIRVNVQDGNPVVFHNKLYFIADVNNGNELWTYDPTAGSTYRIESPEFNDHINGPLAAGTTFYEYNGALYYTANYDTTGWELWRMRDTTAASVKEKSFATTFSVYPSISHSTIHIEIAKPTTITITNILGATVIKREMQASDDIDVSRLSSGTYFIHNADNSAVGKFYRD